MSRSAVQRPSADDPVEYGLVNTVPAEDEWIRHTRHRSLRRRFWFGERDEPPVSALNPVVKPARGRVGICCSGGGIRSASFNLGALQAIQDRDRLRKALDLEFHPLLMMRIGRAAPTPASKRRDPTMIISETGD